MDLFKVALLQLPYGRQAEENLSKGIEACKIAKAMGADLALFPEMYHIGYALPKEASDVPAWQREAIDQESVFFKRFQTLAMELEMAIAITYLEKWPDAPRNTVSIIDRHGSVVLTYAKVHTCDFDSERFLTRGEDFYVCELDTGKGKVKVGAMICFDREFPESARILMLKGAEVLLVPNACPMEANRKNQLKTRAYENMLGVALANSTVEKGHSVAYDCMGFRDDGSTRDTLLVEAGEEEGVYMAVFNLDKMRHFRQSEVWGNAYRRPDSYGLLTSGTVEEPFIRRDKFR